MALDIRPTAPQPTPVPQTTSARPIQPVPRIPQAPAAEAVPKTSYATLPRADESTPPQGLEVFAYTSGQVPLIQNADQPHYIKGAVGTPPEAGQLAKAGVGNLGNPAWQQLVADAVARNGGLGNTEDGFLAFSAEHGFVRLRNDNLTPEQNRQLAGLSLQTGWPIETMPSRTNDSLHDDPEIGRWADEFLGKVQEQFAQFAADPKDDVVVKDGHHRYVLKLDPQSGALVSFHYKKHGGFRGFVEKNAKILGPILDIASLVGGPLVALGAQAFKAAASVAITGKLKLQQVVGAIGAWFGAGGTLAGATAADAALGLGVANLAATAIDGDKITASAVAGALTPAIHGLPGGVLVDNAVRQGLTAVAQAVDTGKVSATTLFQALAPLFLEGPAGPMRDQLTALAQRVDGGHLTAAQVAAALQPLLGGITDDPAVGQALFQGLGALAQTIDQGGVTAQGALGILLPLLQDRLQQARQPRAA